MLTVAPSTSTRPPHNATHSTTTPSVTPPRPHVVALRGAEHTPDPASRTHAAQADARPDRPRGSKPPGAPGTRTWPRPLACPHQRPRVPPCAAGAPEPARRRAHAEPLRGLVPRPAAGNCATSQCPALTPAPTCSAARLRPAACRSRRRPTGDRDAGGRPVTGTAATPHHDPSAGHPGHDHGRGGPGRQPGRATPPPAPRTAGPYGPGRRCSWRPRSSNGPARMGQHRPADRLRPSAPAASPAGQRPPARTRRSGAGVRWAAGVCRQSPPGGRSPAADRAD
jgi:hypothetical protein